MARRSRENELQQDFREAADLVKQGGRALRVAERKCNGATRRFRKLMKELTPVVRLSKRQDADLKAAGDARDSALQRVREAREAWLAAIDKMIVAGEFIAARPRIRIVY